MQTSNKVDSRLVRAMTMDPTGKLACFVKVSPGISATEKAELMSFDYVTHIAGEIYTARLVSTDIDALAQKSYVVSLQGSTRVSP